jgi:hypothetical protein
VGVLSYSGSGYGGYIPENFKKERKGIKFFLNFLLRWATDSFRAINIPNRPHIKIISRTLLIASRREIPHLLLCGES